MEKFRRNYGMLITVLLAAMIARADSLELKNGSLINGRFMGGSENEISFQVGSSVQKFNRSDIVSIKFDSDAAVSDTPHGPDRVPFNDSENVEHASRQTPASVTIPAGTRISVRTIDDIDSAKNHVGDRFQASLEEPLIVDGNVVVAKGADVYGRLAESKESGTFSGRSQLQTRTDRDCGGRANNAAGYRRIRTERQVARGKHRKEDGWRRGLWIAYRRPRRGRRRSSNRCGCWRRSGSRIRNDHKGRPG